MEIVKGVNFNDTIKTPVPFILLSNFRSCNPAADNLVLDYYTNIDIVQVICVDTRKFSPGKVAKYAKLPEINVPTFPGYDVDSTNEADPITIFVNAIFTDNEDPLAYINKACGRFNKRPILLSQTI